MTWQERLSYLRQLRDTVRDVRRSELAELDKLYTDKRQEIIGRASKVLSSTQREFLALKQKERYMATKHLRKRHNFTTRAQRREANRQALIEYMEGRR